MINCSGNSIKFKAVYFFILKFEITECWLFKIICLLNVNLVLSFLAL